MKSNTYGPSTALPWPSVSSVASGLPPPKPRGLRWTELLNEVGASLATGLKEKGLPSHASPPFRPRNLVAIEHADKGVFCFCSLRGGVAGIRWLDRTASVTNGKQVEAAILRELGWTVAATVELPASAVDGPSRENSIAHAVAARLKLIDRDLKRQMLGDIDGFTYLQSRFDEFLRDHPDPSRNVFVMMRFRETEQYQSIHDSIRSALADKNYSAIRADDRDYTGDLWTNIELCMLGSAYGIAVFEDIEERSFNPNVSLELGFMLARQKRCLILKEKRLSSLPTDVVGKLYKSFDMFDIQNSVRTQVLRWLEVDLGI